jgi:ATP-dependent protease ClpP protease subunit
MTNLMEIKDLIKAIEEHQGSFCISYINGQKNPPELFSTKIALDVLPYFYEILEKKGKVDKISLIIRSNGGDIDAAWPVVNLLREYCKELEIIIPENAHSAATLIALGGDKIIMTPFSSLSPIDPQMFINTNLKDNNINIRFSVEDVSGYYQLLDKLKITDEGKIKALEFIAQTINPTLLGQIERVKRLINIYADKILSHTGIDDIKKNNIVRTLIENIPSHQYRISRREALELGLPIHKAEGVLHEHLKQLMKHYKQVLQEDESELLINIPDEVATIERDYSASFIETSDDCFAFTMKYVFHKNGKVDKLHNQWRKIR